jgi:V-type H+-transporting ATPase subunit a
MGILRSEQMKHGTLVLPADRARHFIDLVGAKTRMQFEDMNAKEMHRPYKKHIQRIDEMERILRFLFDELSRLPDTEVIKNNYQHFLDNCEEYKLDEVEIVLKRMYQDFVQFKENNAKLAERLNATLEELYVAQTAIASIVQVGGPRRQGSGLGRNRDTFDTDVTQSLLADEEGAGSRSMSHNLFSNVAGVIAQHDQDRFARALFRATRGNTFTHFQQIPEAMKDTKTGQDVSKAVFVVYFQDLRMGSSMSAMCEKVTKICSMFGVSTYEWPTNREAADETINNLNVLIKDQNRYLQAQETYMLREAFSILEVARPGGNSIIEEWRLFCIKEKSIYATLNCFEGHMNLRANCWYPADQEDSIRATLIRQSSQQHGQSSAMLVSDRRGHHGKTPPTYIRKNEFMGCFQELVDTYGLPRYGEANPAIFTMVTFPFLFGVMYGDIGHGSMLLMAGIWAVWNADFLRYKAPTLYTARYILLMMGFFCNILRLPLQRLLLVGAQPLRVTMAAR